MRDSHKMFLFYVGGDDLFDVIINYGIRYPYINSSIWDKLCRDYISNGCKFEIYRAVYKGLFGERVTVVVEIVANIGYVIRNGYLDVNVESVIRSLGC